MISEREVRLCRKITELWLVCAWRGHKRLKPDKELKVTSVVADNKKGFLKYVNSKMKHCTKTC